MASTSGDLRPVLHARQVFPIFPSLSCTGDSRTPRSRTPNYMPPQRHVALGCRHRPRCLSYKQTPRCAPFDVPPDLARHLGLGASDSARRSDPQGRTEDGRCVRACVNPLPTLHKTQKSLCDRAVTCRELRRYLCWPCSPAVVPRVRDRNDPLRDWPARVTCVRPGAITVANNVETFLGTVSNVCTNTTHDVAAPRRTSRAD